MSFLKISKIRVIKDLRMFKCEELCSALTQSKQIKENYGSFDSIKLQIRDYQK